MSRGLLGAALAVGVTSVALGGGGAKRGDKFKKRTKALGAKISRQDERALAFYAGDAGQKGVKLYLSGRHLESGGLGGRSMKPGMTRQPARRGW